MEIIYYLLHDPEDVYAYGFFASEFKLVKMTKYDRILKVQSIMNNRNYWDEAKLFLESENDILQSNEYKQELEMQAIAHLSESDKQILYKLEIEIKILNDEIQKLDLFQEELCNRKIEINDFIISYNSNLGKFGESIAEQFTVEIYQGQGIFMPSVKEALKELDEIIKDTTFEKLAKLEIKVKQINDGIAKLRTLQ